MTPSLWIPLALSLLVALLACQAVGSRRVASDREAIEAHVLGLFEAYLHHDREAIRRGHTADWKGFPITSRELVRGIDAYMEFAERSLETFHGLGYEIHEMDVEVTGDVGLVFYLATWRYRDADGAERELPLRSVDVYRREAGGWNQAGSNISVVPAPPGA